MMKQFQIRQCCLLIGAWLFFAGLHAQIPGLVRLKQGKFFKDGQWFYPIVMNYPVYAYGCADANGTGDCHVAPDKNGLDPTNEPCNSQTTCNTVMDDQFADIAARGFNTVRLGIPAIADPIDGSRVVIRNPGLEGKYFDPSGNDCTNDPNPCGCLGTFGGYVTYMPCFDGKSWTEIFDDYIEPVIDLADQNGLKVILLLGEKGANDPNWESSFSDYIEAIAQHFANDPRILAFDLYNEPNHSDKNTYSYAHSKNEVCELTGKWYDLIRKHSLNLVTIGVGARAYEDIDWDFNVAKVDFASIHFYSIGENGDGDPALPTEANRPGSFSLSDLTAWYGSVMRSINSSINKPWIIGESGFQAAYDNLYTGDEGTRAEQKQYAIDTWKYARDCGAQGYSWWNYSDGGAYYGIRSSTFSSGAPQYKDVATAFSSAESDWPSVSPTGCPSGAAYLNPFGFSNGSAWGTVTDQNSQPVVGAYVKGTSGSNDHYHTYTDANGSFNLQSDVGLFQYSIIAPGYKIRTAISPLTHNVTLTGTSYTPGEVEVYSNMNIGTSPVVAIEKAVQHLTVQNTKVSQPSGEAYFNAGETVLIKDYFKAENGTRARIWISPVAAEANCSINISNISNKMSPEEESGTLDFGDETISVTVFPQPAGNQVRLRLNRPLKDAEIVLFDTHGQQMAVEQRRDADGRIYSLRFELPAGIYLGRLTEGETVKRFRIAIVK